MVLNPWHDTRIPGNDAVIMPTSFYYNVMHDIVMGFWGIQLRARGAQTPRIFVYSD